MTGALFLKGHGYRTGCVGKWHVGWTWPHKSEDRDDVDFRRPIQNGPTAVGVDYFFGISPHTPILPSGKFRGISGTNDYGDFCVQVNRGGNR